MSDSSLPKNSSTTFTVNVLNIDHNNIKDSMINAGGTGLSGDCITFISGTDTTGNSSDLNFSDHINLVSSAATTCFTYSTGDTITLSGLDSLSPSYPLTIPVEWQNEFPSWNKVKDMCEKYPGLKIAFDNFRVFYEMVKDDYDNPTPKK